MLAGVFIVYLDHGDSRRGICFCSLLFVTTFVAGPP